MPVSISTIADRIGLQNRKIAALHKGREEAYNNIDAADKTITDIRAKYTDAEPSEDDAKAITAAEEQIVANRKALIPILEVEMLRRPMDVLLVVGGYNSSNTTHLVEIGEKDIEARRFDLECCRSGRPITNESIAIREVDEPPAPALDSIANNPTLIHRH